LGAGPVALAHRPARSARPCGPPDLTGEVFLTIKISPRRIGYEEETLADSDEVNLGGRRCSRPQGTWRWPQILAGRGLAAVSVAIDPAPFRGVLPCRSPRRGQRSRRWATRPTGTARSR